MVMIFYTLFINSLNMAFLILLLVLMEPLLKRFLSAGCLYWLWIILLVGLLLPIRVDTNKALIYIGLPQRSVEDEVDLGIPSSSNLQNEIDRNQVLQNQLTQDTISRSRGRQESWYYFMKQIVTAELSNIAHNKYLLLSLVWGIVAILLLAVKGFEHVTYVKRLKRFIIPVGNEDIMKEYNHCIRELKDKHRERVSLINGVILYKCSIITCPISIGILKPVILLPNESYVDKDMYFIIKHELIHILRRDSFVKLIRLIVLSLNWYNPLVYVLSRHLEEWCEASCDEQVLLNATRSECFSYSRLLLRCTKVKKHTVSIVNRMGGNNMKKRLKSIIEQRKKYSGMVPVVLLLCIVLTTVIVSSKSPTKALSSGDTMASPEESLVQLEEEKIEEEKNDYVGSNEKNSLRKDSNLADGKSLEKDINITDSNSNNTLPSTAALGNKIIEYAMEAEGTPYLWGGDDLTKGVDSSGFTQAVYKKIGYDLPRTASEQAVTYQEVPMDCLQPGDLIFYEGGEEDKVNHVGIYLGEDKIIHAKNAHDGVVIQDINYRRPLSAGRVIS